MGNNPDKELNRYKHKVATQEAENRRLKNAVNECEQGLTELSRAVDGILAVVAVTCGKQLDDSTWEMVLPNVDLATRYNVCAGRIGDTDEYRIRATRLGGEKGCQEEDRSASAEKSLGST